MVKMVKKRLTVDIVDFEEELDLVFRRLASELVHCVQEFLNMAMITNIIIIVIIIILIIVILVIEII